MKTKERKEKVSDFIVRHKTDCYRAFRICNGHIGFNTKEGRKLIDFARKEIGYSDQTWNCNIYNVLWKAYKSITIDGKMGIKAKQPSDDKDIESIKDRILKEYNKGNVVVSGFEGLQVTPLDGIIKQPVDGLLYDLNRNEATILTFINDPKWVNDYAVTKVIRALKKRIEELEDSKNK
jgi:hypothetical protein